MSLKVRTSPLIGHISGLLKFAIFGLIFVYTSFTICLRQHEQNVTLLARYLLVESMKITMYVYSQSLGIIVIISIIATTSVLVIIKIWNYTNSM